MYFSNSEPMVSITMTDETLLTWKITYVIFFLEHRRASQLFVRECSSDDLNVVVSIHWYVPNELLRIGLYSKKFSLFFVKGLCYLA